MLLDPTTCVKTSSLFATLLAMYAMSSVSRNRRSLPEPIWTMVFICKNHRIQCAYMARITAMVDKSSTHLFHSIHFVKRNLPLMPRGSKRLKPNTFRGYDQYTTMFPTRACIRSMHRRACMGIVSFFVCLNKSLGLETGNRPFSYVKSQHISYKVEPNVVTVHYHGLGCPRRATCLVKLVICTVDTGLRWERVRRMLHPGRETLL